MTSVAFLRIEIQATRERPAKSLRNAMVMRESLKQFWDSRRDDENEACPQQSAEFTRKFGGIFHLESCAV